MMMFEIYIHYISSLSNFLSLNSGLGQRVAKIVLEDGPPGQSHWQTVPNLLIPCQIQQFLVAFSQTAGVSRLLPMLLLHAPLPCLQLV